MINLVIDLNSVGTLFCSILTIFFGLPAVICFLPEEFKKDILSFDRDGLKICLLGWLAILLSFFVPDYSSAYVSLCLGIFFMLFGIWVAVIDNFTDKWLKREAGKFYAAIAFVVFFAASLITNGGFNYNLDGIIYLILPIGLACLLLCMGLFSLMSAKFKQRLLPLDFAGANMAVVGLGVLLLSPFAGTNIALTISAITLACGLMSFGGVISLNDRITKVVLKPIWLIFEVPLVIGLIVLSRLTF